jgi:hypothetical protein
MTRRVAIRGYKLDKAGKLVPDYKHLPVNIQLQKRVSKHIRAGQRTRAAGTPRFLESQGEVSDAPIFP